MVLMNKDIGLLFEYARSKFTATDNKIADYFLARQPVKTIEELAVDIGVSTASITRFCRKIGLNNLKELLFLYQEQLDSKIPQPDAGMKACTRTILTCCNSWIPVWMKP